MVRRGRVSHCKTSPKRKVIVDCSWEIVVTQLAIDLHFGNISCRADDVRRTRTPGRGHVRAVWPSGFRRPNVVVDKWHGEQAG